MKYRTKDQHLLTFTVPSNGKSRNKTQIKVNLKTKWKIKFSICQIFRTITSFAVMMTFLASKLGFIKSFGTFRMTFTAC